MKNILDIIVENKRNEIALLKNNFNTRYYESQANFGRQCISLKQGIRKTPFGIIAEIKRKSPSAGDIDLDLSVAEKAKDYELGGACAISCLTDQKFFGGNIKDLAKLRSHTSLPILRKDFIVDYIQIFEAKAAGADAILLISEVLDDKKIINMTRLAHDLGMEVLLELHSKSQISKICDDADIIGVNNRNLDTQNTDILNSKEMYSYLPETKIKITESGLKNQEDLRAMAAIGFEGALIGESILKNTDPKSFIQNLNPNVVYAH